MSGGGAVMIGIGVVIVGGLLWSRKGGVRGPGMLGGEGRSVDATPRSTRTGERLPTVEDRLGDEDRR